jgi:uncharacterized protein YdhG (YjbR/CyaY superfamily)
MVLSIESEEKILRYLVSIYFFPLLPVNNDILHYNQQLSATDKEICDRLLEIIHNQIPQAESKIWHGHPVWFLDGDPILGYSNLKK